MSRRRAQRIHAALFRATGQQADAANAFVRIGALRVAAALRIVAGNRHTTAGRVGDGVRRALAHDGAQRQAVEHRARLLCAAHVRLGARVLAAFVVAGQMRCTVGVDATLRLGGQWLTLAALHVRIADRSGRTRALRLMALAFALRVRAAGVRIADGSANPVQAIASLVVGTVLVVLAHAGHASDQGIALGAGRARTGRAMILRQTLGVVAAADGAIVGARIQTLVIVAGLVVRTIVVRLAFGSEALSLRIAAPALRAEAQRTVLGGTAFGVGRARIAIGARIATALVDAGQRVGAFAVGAAFRLQVGRWFVDRLAEAIAEGIADEAGRTAAGGASVLGGTGGRRGAWVGIGAGIDLGRGQSYTK